MEFWEDEEAPERAILLERDLYCGRGRNLQGSVLPRWGGLFATKAGGGTAWVSVLEDVRDAVPTMPPHAGPFEERYARDVLTKYDALHAAGIAHGDVEARHVRIGMGPAAHLGADSSLLPPGTDLGLRIIDLDRASTEPAAIELERRYVRRWLGLEIGAD